VKDNPLGNEINDEMWCNLINTTLYLNKFRRKPAISKFD